jgi:hypothetical protein
MPTKRVNTKELLPEDIQAALAEEAAAPTARPPQAIKASSLSDDPAADGIAPDSPTEEIAQFWHGQLDDARKRELKFRKSARPVVEIYEAKDCKADSFNILYANTETLLPAVYNQSPRPVVKRKQDGNTGPGGSPSNEPGANGDMLQLTATRVAQRLLEQFLDTGATDTPNFDELAAQSCLQALITGRGLMRFRYDADIEDQTIDGVVVSKVKSENIRGELVDWDRVLFGYARSWYSVPWLAFEHYMTREELVDNFGDMGRDVPLNATTSETDTDSDEGSVEDKAPSDSQGAKLALVYEIWDKTKKQVLFYAPSFDKSILKSLSDPLGLTGFFPCPAPLTFFTKVSSMVPTPLYEFYKEQAEELNRVSKRINKIIKALKVRGFYDSQFGNLGELLTKDDNTLLPAENVISMQQGQTLEKSIWLMPIQELVVVLQQLYVQRTQVKALIYEITGISDIVRGASAASETLGAQKIKESWVTLRIKRLQKAVHKYLRNSLRIMAEIALTKLAPETVQAMTGVDLPTEEEKAQAQIGMQMWQQQQQMAAMSAAPQLNPTMNGVGASGPPPMGQGAPAPAATPFGPPMPQPGPVGPPAAPAGPPPGPPPGPPQQLTATLAMPTMVEVLALLNNDLQRRYTIDIETNSTVDAEATEDKQQIGEFLNAMAQFLSGVAPLVQNGTLPFEAAQAIMLAVTRRYRFGDEVEEAIKKMQAPQPDKADPKVEAEKQMMQLDIKKGEQEMQLKKQMAALEIQLKTQEMQFKEKELQMETQFKEQEMQMKMQDMQRKGQMGEMAHASKMRVMQHKEQQAMMAPAPQAQPAGGPPAGEVM